MALIECNHCGNKISDKAVLCPKCGKRFASVTPVDTPFTQPSESLKESRGDTLAITFIVLAVISIICSYLSSIRLINEYSYTGYFGSEVFFGWLFVGLSIIFLLIPVLKSKTKPIKWTSAVLLVAYVIGFFVLKHNYYQDNISYVLNFEKDYCNSNVLTKLNGSELETYGCTMKIADNKIHLSTSDGDLNLSAPIKSVSNNGTIISEVVSKRGFGKIYIQIIPNVYERYTDFFSGPWVHLEAKIRVNLRCTNKSRWDRSFYNEGNFGVCRSWDFY